MKNQIINSVSDKNLEEIFQESKKQIDITFDNLKEKLAEVDKTKHLSRITIVTKGTPQVIQQIKLQLGKLVPVHKVADFSRNDPNILFRELALFKLTGSSAKLNKAKKLCKNYNCVVLDNLANLSSNLSSIVLLSSLPSDNNES